MTRNKFLTSFVFTDGAAQKRQNATAADINFSVTSLGEYWKFLEKIFLTKVAQIFANDLAFLNNQCNTKKNCFCYYLGNYCKI